MGIIRVHFDITGQLKLCNQHRQMLQEKWQYSGASHQLCTDFKKAYDSIRRKVLYSIHAEFGMPLKLQGGSNMTGTNCDLFTHKSSRFYLNHLE
jgi:hypothetical protein